MRNQNKLYAMLREGQLFYAPVPLEIEGQRLYTNDSTPHYALGYSRVVQTWPERKSGYRYTSHYEQTDSQTITEVWDEEKEQQEHDNVSIEERVNDLEIAVCELSDMLFGELF